MYKKNPEPKFVVCVKNEGYLASLERRNQLPLVPAGAPARRGGQTAGPGAGGLPCLPNAYRRQCRR